MNAETSACSSCDKEISLPFFGLNMSFSSITVTNGTFSSMDLALFLECILSYCDNPITRYTIFYLFSHEISISLMLSQPSFNFRAVHGYAFFLLFHSDASRITHVMLPFYNTAYLISEPTAQGLGFTLCIQYR